MSHKLTEASILFPATRNQSGYKEENRITYALARKVEILSLEFTEYIKELLQETRELFPKLIVVLNARHTLAESRLYKD